MRVRTSNCVALGVPNMAEAAAHYENVAGWTVTKRTEDWIELSTGDLRIFLCQDDVMTPVFDFVAVDVETTRVDLLEKGWTVAPFSDQELFMTDPFGYTWCISKPRVS